MATVDTVPRDCSWVRNNLGVLARLNTVCFQGPPWNERWSDDEEGDNPRTHSPAMVRELLAEVHGKPFFFAAEAEEELVAVGVAQVLNNAGAEAMHVAPFGAQAGDFYQSLVIVRPDYQGNGVSSGLIDSRLALAERLAAPRIWVQTHVDNERVRCAYERRGFRTAGTLMINSCQAGEKLLPSQRVILVRNG